MIPAIKESNQLKQFLGVREHCPEFYNDSLDQLNEPTEKLGLLKDFIKPEPAKKENLSKYIMSGSEQKKKMMFSNQK